MFRTAGTPFPIAAPDSNFAQEGQNAGHHQRLSLAAGRPGGPTPAPDIHDFFIFQIHGTVSIRLVRLTPFVPNSHRFQFPVITFWTSVLMTEHAVLRAIQTVELLALFGVAGMVFRRPSASCWQY
jgi:hypothetical protein